ncbi:solute-binding protein [Catenulispora acidiphila DSM 44928]|uniref:Solute-binding protein n=1 Tax=Catenulispora acidiphila (strain DSM 44928 / JCM 14897 / NBRC 102108 / NRRL B-24433 / ID139908) TaxID=479433 RepID=C7QF49_CATAD|nr:substrate-binding domain-containing protein [Catenulispora acidiphila]ACU74807.1 solute-binding protein [Catenulispora acidiphila DSM 44928]
MRKAILAITALGAAVALSAAGCSSSKSSSSGSTTGGGSSTTSAAAGSSSSSSSSGTPTYKNNKVGILLPDTNSSPRWVNSDPDELKTQCAQYGLTCDIQNSNGSATTMTSQAQSMLNEGVGVLMLTNLDSGSAKAIEAQAQAKGVVTIDYDRLTLGGTAQYYVSFDNVAVGKAQGTALTKCTQVAGKTAVKYVEEDGAATDNNATLFKQGYDSVLKAQTGWTQAGDQSGNWDNPAGTAQSVFQKLLQGAPDLNAVMVANDEMANAAITVLKQQGLNGKVAVSGQDATATGLQNILNGDQCFTIYKPVKGEADVAVKLASQVLSGQKPTAPAVVHDPTGNRDVPSYLATPVVVDKSNITLPFTDGYQKAADVCTGDFAAKCTAAGIK